MSLSHEKTSKSTLKHSFLYFIVYAISGCNYYVFGLFLKGNGPLFVGLYNGVTALVLFVPVYPFIEKIIFPGESKAVGALTLQDCKTACTKYGWALILSVFSSVGWQAITYGYLIKYGALLALLVTTFSRLLTPPLSSYVFGDRIENKSWYWMGLGISLLGLAAYQYGRDDKIPVQITWTYILLSLTSLVLIVVGTIVKRFTTSDPERDSIPIRKRFLGISYLENYHIAVRTREFITDAGTFAILSIVGLWFQFFYSLKHDVKWPNELLGVFWIGVVGGLAYTVSVKLTNRLSNVTTAAIDGLRPFASYFLYPLVGLLLAGIPYILNTKTVELWGYEIPCLSLIGILISCMGFFLSLKFGKPEKGRTLKQ